MDVKVIPDAMVYTKDIKDDMKKAAHDALSQIQSEIVPAKKDEQKPTSIAQVQPSGEEGGPTKAVKTPHAYPPVPIGLYTPPPRDLVKKKEGSSETKVDSKGKETTTTTGTEKSLA